MQRRIYKRTPTRIKVRFCCCKTDNSGTVTNISENGMFIYPEKIFFPFDLRFEIQIPLWDKTIKIPVEVVRISKSFDVYSGIAVKVLNPHQNYSKFVDSLSAFYKREFVEYQTADISA